MHKKITEYALPAVKLVLIPLFIIIGLIPLYRSILGIGSYIHAGWFDETLYANLQVYGLGIYLLILFAELVMVASGILLLPLRKIEAFWNKIKHSPWWAVVTGFLGFFILMKGIWTV